MAAVGSSIKACIGHQRAEWRSGEKGFNALKLSQSPPELIRYRQVLLPRLNTMSHQMALEFAKVCYANKPDMERGRLQSR
jgi:hypothetical protein